MCNFLNISIKNLAALLTLISFNVYAQMTLPLNENGKYEFTLIKNIDSLNKIQIMSKTIIWVSETFKGSPILIKDEQSGIIKLDPNVNIPAYIDNRDRFGVITLSITIHIKDNKIKIVANNFEHIDNFRTGNYKCSCGELEKEKTWCLWRGKWDSLKRYAQKDIESLAENLIKKIETKETW